MHRKMCADPALQAMVDRTDVQIDGFHRAERPLDFGERFVAAHRLGRCYLLLRNTGADDVEPIERGFGGDFWFQPLELEPALLDAELLDAERKVLADFEPVEDLADPTPILSRPRSEPFSMRVRTF